MESKPQTSKSVIINSFEEARQILSKVSDSPDLPFSKSAPINKAASDFADLYIVNENDIQVLTRNFLPR